MRERESHRRRPKGALVLALMLATALVFAACGDDDGGATTAPAAEPITIRLAHVLQPTTLEHQFVTEIAASVLERTNGEIVIEIYPAAQLGSTTDLAEQAAAGEPVITFLDASYASTLGVAELGILGGPFLFDDNDQAQAFTETALFAEWIDRLADEAGLRVLAFNWFGGARHMIGHKPYPEPSDLAGVKVRVPPVPTWTITFEALGAVPTTVESSETYSALSQKVVDAAESPIGGIKGNKWQEVAKEITLTAHFNLFLGFAMSEEVFQSLSAEHQAILTDEFQQKGKLSTAGYAANEAATIAEFEAAGVTIHEANLEAYRAATRSFYDAFPAWPEGLYEQVRAAVGG